MAWVERSACVGIEGLGEIVTREEKIATLSLAGCVLFRSQGYAPSAGIFRIGFPTRDGVISMFTDNSGLSWIMGSAIYANYHGIPIDWENTINLPSDELITEYLDGLNHT